MRENKFQSDLKKEIKSVLPDCIITKLDCNDIQGIPDLLILNGPKWATLECKKNANASHRPNQDYYVDKMSRMSFSSFSIGISKAIRNIILFIITDIFTIG